MQQKNIIIPKTARYFILGESSEKIEHVWIVCHGYAQLANYFLRNFECLNNEKHLIISAEGLHRFYWQGFTGRVVASWMTKEDRLEDIKDYCNYLDMVYNEVLSSLKNKKVKINVLGFSQGTATVLRWLTAKKPRVDNLFLWGGTFPSDIDFEMDKEYFSSIKTYFVMGDKDEYNDGSTIIRMEKILSKNEIPFEFVSFDGKHVIDQKTLVMLAAKL